MKWIIALFASSLVYAVVRYVAFTPKNLPNIPLFVVNKAVAMAAALCFVAAFVQLLRGQRGTPTSVDSGAWFRAGVFGVVWHIPMALALIRPGYFNEFFAPGADGAAASGRMSFAGELVLCFGGLAVGTIYLLSRPQCPPMTRWRLSLSAMAMLLVHVLAMGYCRGLNINAGHGYLPPMWLLSAIGAAVGFIVLLMSRPKASAS